ncbi:MAG: hypothetical protein RLZZ297_2017 [Chloroflexota bacterium]|jgi:glycosyltransferase involved in cell wall biosynthesis
MPFPPVTGMTRHIAAMVPALAAHYRITLFVLCDPDQPLDWQALAGSDLRAEAFTRVARPHPLRPPGLAGWHSPALDAAITALLRDDPPDLVQLEYSGMAIYAPRFGRIPTICTATALDTLGLWRRLAHTPGGYQWIRRALGLLLVAWHEWRALRRVSLVVTHGSADLVLLRDYWRIDHAVHVPSGLPLGAVAPAPAGAPPRILCVGHFAHQPNRDGVAWFLTECWPAVRQRYPDLVLDLVGARPADIGIVPGVCAHGVTSAVAAFYATATVVVVPIWWGSGVRIKILEAVGAGRPIVSTPMACEGLPLRHDHELLVAADADAFIAAICRLLDDPALRRRLTDQARVALADRQWPAVAAQLVALYRPLIG